MSESWVSRRREADQAENDFAARPLPDMAEIEEESGGRPRRRWHIWLLRIVLTVAGLAWLGIIAWSYVDPTIGVRIAPFLENIIRLAAPLVLVVGIAIFVMMLGGHFDDEGRSGKLSGEDAKEAANMAAQAAARIADAHSQILSQTKAYAAAADRSATALQDAVAGMAGQSDLLARTTATSIEALTTLSERMNAFDAAAPQIEQRLADLTETLTCLGIELRERTAYLETRLKDAATAAVQTRDELISASDSLNARLAGIRDGARAAGEDLTELSELSSARLDFTLDRVKTMLDVTEERMEAQNAALSRLVDRSRESIETAGQQSLDRFTSHCREIETVLETLDARIARQSETGTAWLESAAAGVENLSGQFDALEQSAVRRTERLGTAMMELSAETRRLTDALQAGDQSSEQLIKRAEALLTILDSSVRELDGTVPGAIGRVEERIIAMRQRIADTVPGIENVEAVASSVTGRMEDASKLASGHAATLDSALARSQTALAEQKAQVEALAGAIAEASGRIASLSDSAGPQMVEALSRVRETADAAARKAHDAIMDVIPQAANRLSEASSGAVQIAVTETVDKQLQRLTEAANLAVKAAKEAAGALDVQLKALHSTSDALERRLAGSAKKIESQDRELLTKRSGELIEMLNSRAIDVSKWLGHDISQAEWTAYLRGDQGIFARRAVRLLSRSDARSIARIYSEDADFAEHVNRYVHDFEALLKGVLEARDGSALAVTMLSSDLGKLYVALAQASERLKTS